MKKMIMMIDNIQEIEVEEEHLEEVMVVIIEMIEKKKDMKININLVVEDIMIEEEDIIINLITMYINCYLIILVICLKE